MIIASMHSRPYQTIVTNDANSIVVDTSKNGIGGRTGFKPHELLEAALAACTNLTLRVAAEKLGVSVTGLAITVDSDLTATDLTKFVVSIAIEGNLDGMQRQQLLKSVRLCPVSKILGSSISVVYPHE